MDGFALGAVSAFWLGVLTSISPCPLATNIAAISYIGRDLSNPRRAFAAGISYTLGRSLIYALLSAVLVASLLAMPVLAQALQRDLNKVLGPLMIVVGLVLLNVIPLPVSGSSRLARLAQRFSNAHWWTAAVLGALFAISFCPVSAALFFGSLLPLAAKHESTVLFPVLYGFGTGLPVAVTAVVIVFATRSVGGLFARLTTIERYARAVTAIVFLLVGVYYILLYWFGVQIL